MIRREIHLPDQPPQWLIISQPEHARLSRCLAESAVDWSFPCQISWSSDDAFSKGMLAEITSAIERHDDGWIGWESYPRLDPIRNRPYAFYELPREDVLLIWDKSIESAEQIGPLAAWMVAGHFETLLRKSDDAASAGCVAWLDETAERRKYFMGKWKASNNKFDDDSLDVLAQEALDWLREYDEISLWLCSKAPIAGELREDWPEIHEVVHEGYHSHTLIPTHSVHELFRGMHAYRVNTEPWLSPTVPLLIQVRGKLVPQKKHRSTDTYNKYGEEYTARWLLMPDNDDSVRT